MAGATIVISTRRSRKLIASLWLAASLLLFIILAVQSLRGVYNSQADEAWGWLLPAVMPTLSLIVGVLVADATTERRTDKNVEFFFFVLAGGLSAIYLVLVALVLLLQPYSEIPRLDLMRRSSLWLGPLQGLVAGALGVFFVRDTQRGDSPTRRSHRGRA